MPSPDKLSKEQILAALARVNELLHENGVIGEFCIIDNATRVIAFEVRNTTYNLEADTVTKNAVLNCARQVADEFNLEEDWINSSARGFISELEEVTHHGITILYHINHRQNPAMITSSHETTLHESMLFASNSVDFDNALANFLDQFNRNPSTEILVKEPPLLAAKLNDGGLADAYLASTAAHLCHHRGLKFPLWVNQPSRVLQKPWFAAKTPSIKAIFLQESPAAFRIRNLFVSANALLRA